MNCNRILSFCGTLFLTVLFNNENVPAQITIQSDEFPSAVGTYIITEDDTVDTVEVDVGLPGENQVWKLDYFYPHEYASQLIVDKNTTPFHSDFPEASIVTRYTGKMGQLIHSYYFDDTQGMFYSYQKKNQDSLMLQGIGIDSATVTFNIFSFGYSGAVDIEPDMLFSTFPLQYGDHWESVSKFAIEVDTLLLGSRVTLTADVKDSVYNTVDGWGTIILPSASYECLRLKSYITLTENLYMNGQLFKSRSSRTINYHWFAKDYGIVAKIISHHDQSDDNFKIAKQVSRLRRFNPQIELSMPDTLAAPKDTLTLPIFTTDLTSLNISAIQMQLLCNTKILTPIDMITSGSMTEFWNNWSYTLSDSGIKLDLSGDNPLEGAGVLCFVRFSVNQNAQQHDSSSIDFKSIVVNESGPTIASRPGLVKVQEVSEVKGNLSYNTLTFMLHQNYPNPFNAATTFRYVVPERGHVTLKIFDTLGREIEKIIDDDVLAGEHEVHWNAAHLSSGLYFYELKSDKFEQRKKMLVIK